MRLATAIVAALALTACETTKQALISPDFQAPTERTRIVVMRPDVHMSLITTGGLEEPRADWTAQAEENILAAVDDTLRNRGHDVVPFDPSLADGDRQNQLILLHEAVGASIMQYSSVAQTTISTVVPSKEETFDWTLGAGAAEVGAAYDADFALFTTAYGGYASAGRVAAAVIASALFGTTPSLGARWTQASLVDLRTGDIVWMNVAVEGDPRDEAGAQAVIDRLTADLPL